MASYNESEIVELAKEILALRAAEQNRLHKISRYMRGRSDPPFAPKGASTEYRWLMRRSKRNFLPLVVSVISQNLHVDGYRASTPEGPEGGPLETPPDVTDDKSWQAFRANRMISRQHAVHRSVTKYGLAYVTVLPGTMAVGEESKDVPVIRPSSPRKMTALYADDVDDEWPMVAVEEVIIADRSAPGHARRLVTVYDDDNRFVLTGDLGPRQDLEFAAASDPLLNGKPAISAHDMGVCPVVRFLYEADLDGEVDCAGEVEPLIDLQDGINFDTFNLMLSEQFAAYRQRWVTGMAPTDETARPAAPFNPGVDRVWSAEDSDTRFGEFDVTPLQPYIDARESTIRHMSTLSQIPPYHLLGQVANLSAEALAAARDGLDRKVEELQSILTDPWRNTFRLTAKAAKDSEGWDDLFGAVIWRDTSARAFAATIDGLGKAAQMLGVPATELWRRIPGATADDVESWKDAAEHAGAMEELDKLMQSALTGGAMTANPSASAPYQAGSIGHAAINPPKPAGAGPPAPGAPGNATPAKPSQAGPAVPPRGA